jgi:sulfite reductase (NADPH) flavoprotein alpha-component
MPASPQSGPSPASTDAVELAGRLHGLDAASLCWLSGYAAALAAQAAPAPAFAVIPGGGAQPAARLSIVYGSQTGNARRLAERLAQGAEAMGLAVRLARADAYPVRELKDERLLYIVISTQGDGDPPDDARGFLEFLAGRRAPALDRLQFAVLALGDSSYPQFCAIGRRLDARLAELGGRRLLDLAEADLDIETVAAPWQARALQAAREALAANASRASITPLRPTAAPAPPAWHRERPFAAELLLDQRITARDSDKDVRHLELSLQGAGFDYAPGDTLGVWPQNPPALVDAVLAALDLDGDAEVAHGDERRPLRTWLSERRELTRLSRPFLAAHAALAEAADLNRLLAPGEASALAGLLSSHQPIDVLRRWPAAWEPEALVAALRPLTPRLYSIASSRAVVGDEAHLTVDVVGYEAFGEPHLGAASSFLATRGEGATVPVFLERNERFRLPADGDRDLIMIGSGTGIAPFRGFVQERAATAARGRHWLVFGARRIRCDFLYQLEWQEALRNGTLHRIDLAFSRDTAEKIYVQQRLRENGRELYAWLEGGAHLYVCGATAMGRDVHAALIDIVATHGGRDHEAAAGYLDELARQGRYARDIY